MDAGKDSRPPRGALAVIAVGLLATVAAMLLSTDKVGGSSVELDWVAGTTLPDSATAPIPGGGSMRLGAAGLRASEKNADGELVFRATAVLRIEAGSAVGQGRLRCRMDGDGAELGRTVSSRAAFPRSSGEYNLTKQDVSKAVGVKLHIRGAEYAALPLADAFPVYTDLPGVTVSWQPFRTHSHEWQWGLPPGRPAEPLRLGFATFWRTAGRPAANAACTLETAAGAATVRTAGALG